MSACPEGKRRRTDTFHPLLDEHKAVGAVLLSGERSRDHFDRHVGHLTTPPRTFQQLRDALQTAWFQIPLEIYQHLTESLPARLVDVFAAKGAPECKGGGNWRSPVKPSDQPHGLARFPHTIIRERPCRESNPVRLVGRRVEFVGGCVPDVIKVPCSVHDRVEDTRAEHFRTGYRAVHPPDFCRRHRRDAEWTCTLSPLTSQTPHTQHKENGWFRPALLFARSTNSCARGSAGAVAERLRQIRNTPGLHYVVAGLQRLSTLVPARGELRRKLARCSLGAPPPYRTRGYHLCPGPALPDRGDKILACPGHQLPKADITRYLQPDLVLVHASTSPGARAASCCVRVIDPLQCLVSVRLVSDSFSGPRSSMLGQGGFAHMLLNRQFSRNSFSMRPRWLSGQPARLHHGEPGSIPGRVTPGYSHVGIVPGDTTGQRVFSGISSLTPPFHKHLNHLIGSQDLAIKSRPNLFTHSLTLSR
ncbi:hypothetical protein PR048_019548 [Dryococelus australis]|uniref:Uncharacterized protein n=1 Tax=Dryococelus australis TaxID=614101 RepID=A0ABQ9H3S1_9NEOP|nr:hypothetical protein PR048_019548 [Dryococelus australis]